MVPWTQRKVFISHYKGDRQAVDQFIDRFANREGIFIPKVLGAGENYDQIDSSNTDYVMSQIRQKYLQDSTVTIVLVGTCTHSRRYIDWEIKSSLTQGQNTPNGLIAINLPSMGNVGGLPPRLADNRSQNNENCFATYWVYPNSGRELWDWIEDAFAARTQRAHLISNGREMMKYNATCGRCGVTH